MRAKKRILRGGTYLNLEPSDSIENDLGLNVVDRVRRLHLQGNGLPSKSFHEDLHLEMMAFRTYT